MQPDVPGAERIEWRAVAELVPYARNARTHSEEQIGVLAASIGRFGFVNPVIVDAAGGIMAGHGRVLAARRLGMERVPVIRIEHLDDDERRAFILADNKIADMAGYDDDLLRVEIAELQDADFDLGGLGFSEKELAKLLVEPDPAEEARDDEADPDAAPEARTETVSKPGDVWLLGPHRVVCGDSTDAATIEAVMGDGLADMVFTDPPYGMSYGGGRAAGSTPKGARVKAHGMIAGDDKRGEDLIALVRDAVGRAVERTKDDASVYVCLPWRTYAEFETALSEIGLDVTACIVWDKRSIGLGNAHYRPQHEFIFYCARGQWFGDKSQSDVWSQGREASTSYVHPTQKPVKLIERALRNSSRRGDTVLDPFGGSGTTLIACERRGRVARLVELDPKYVDVIVRRWQQFTGRDAVLGTDGRSFAEVESARQAEAA